MERTGRGRRDNPGRRRLLLPALAALLALASATSAIPAAAQIVNDAIATGEFGGQAVVSPPATAVVPVLPATASLAVSKSGVLSDDDGVPGVSAGDSVTWTFTAANTGNVRLTAVSVSDPKATMTLVSGDFSGPGVLDPGETWTWTGVYKLTQPDLDAGKVDNEAALTSAQLPPQTASASVEIAPASALRVEKQLIETVLEFPGYYKLKYRIVLTNTGQATLGPITLEDDLGAAVAPGLVYGKPAVTLSGFSGSGGAHGGYDGVGNIQLLQGDVRLEPGQTGAVEIYLGFDTEGQDIDGYNTAVATAPQLPGPVSSNDPVVTPDNPDDVQPTPVTMLDTDRDGSTDYYEVAAADRDGDGMMDPKDYDPTGYFYCESDGAILAGGMITVTELASGLSQAGVGTTGPITVVQDGGQGFYQFHVTAAGRYRLSYQLPPGGVASTTRLAGPAVDLTSFLPANPAILGSGEFGATGRLADFSAAANPFHLEFDIEAGDPNLFNNNIPLQDCGDSRLTLAKAVTSGPALEASGKSRIGFRLTLAATGSERVENVTLRDDLAAVFGAGNFEIVSMAIASAPVAFGASANPGYDGSGDPSLLTAGGSLDPGGVVEVDLEVLASAPSGAYDNIAVAGGTRPLDGSPIAEATAAAGVLLVTSGSQDLVATKAATPGSVQRGQPIAYTISFENTLAAARSGVDLVDRLPPGLSYVPGSAQIDGVAVEPVIAGRELSWPNRTVPASGSTVITLAAVPGAAAAGPEFTNNAWARDPVSGLAISNIASATVRLRFEPVFDCSDIIGRVYEDRNSDGYAQDGEPGVPGVRLATVRGLLVTTDRFGRFSIACADIPDADIGSNFILKVDERTLPAGWRVTSENPRVVRITRGRMTAMDFGVSGGRLVEFDLDARAFEDGRTTLKPVTLAAVNRLLDDLEAGQSILRITYRGPVGDLSRDRLNLVAALVRAAWSARNPGRELSVATRLAQ